MLAKTKGKVCFPEPEVGATLAAWKIGFHDDVRYITIEECDDGWDYSIYNSSYNLLDGGIMTNQDLSILQVREEILSANGLQYRPRFAADYESIKESAT